MTTGSAKRYLKLPSKFINLSFLIVFFAMVPCVSATSEKPIFFQARGMVVAAKQPILSSQVAAQVLKLSVREGEEFVKGDNLVIFDDILLQTRWEKTKAELEAAEVTLENKQKLANLQSVGALDVVLAQAEVRRWKAEMKIVSVALARCKIKAPFNGRVVTFFVHEHESVAQNVQILEILSTDQLEIEVMAPADWLSWLRPGLSFSVQLGAPFGDILAKIITIGAVVDPINKTVKLKGQLLDYPKSVLPGMMATVQFPTPENTTGNTKGD